MTKKERKKWKVEFHTSLITLEDGEGWCSVGVVVRLECWTCRKLAVRGGPLHVRQGILPHIVTLYPGGQMDTSKQLGNPDKVLVASAMDWHPIQGKGHGVNECS